MNNDNTGYAYTWWIDYTVTNLGDICAQIADNLNRAQYAMKHGQVELANEILSNLKIYTAAITKECRGLYDTEIDILTPAEKEEMNEIGIPKFSKSSTSRR